MSHPHLSIVIPAFNEEARIDRTLEQVLACIDQQSWDAEILVVDDSSLDRTASIVEAWMNRHPLHLIKNRENRGKGYSIRNGILKAAGDIVMFTDADLSAPIVEAERLMAAIQSGADIAIGSRWLDRARPPVHQPLYRQFFGRCFNWVTRTVTVLPLRTRSAASRHSNAQRPSWSFGFRPLNGGVSIQSCSSLPANLDIGSPRFL